MKKCSAQRSSATTAIAARATRAISAGRHARTRRRSSTPASIGARSGAAAVESERGMGARRARRRPLLLRLVGGALDLLAAALDVLPEPVHGVAAGEHPGERRQRERDQLPV